MSDEALEDALADELGVDRETLDDLVYDLDPHETSDGMHIGYNVTFDVEASDPDALAKVQGLVNGTWIRIGLLGIE